MAKKIIVAKYGGFCFGVKKAVDTAFEAAEKHQSTGEKLFSYGELIHNEQVIELLENKGVKLVDDLADLNEQTVILRSHGAPKNVYDYAQENQIKLVDTTCTFVKRVHKIVQEHANKGYHIIIAGDHKHPEVVGIVSWADDYSVVANAEDVANIQTDKPVCLVAQTTLNTLNWLEIKKAIEEKFKDNIIFNTICSATEKRQNEVLEISKKVDYMLVVGGKKSSNTKKLFDISKKICKNADIIQNFSQIDMKKIEKYDIIGVVAGASTPDWVIDEIIQKLKIEGEVSI